MTAWTTATVPAFAVTLLRAHQGLLAAVARASLAREGRGLVAVTYRGPMPAETPEIRALQIGYRPRADYARRTATQTGAGRVLADVILHRLDTYDPLTTMVVAVVVGPQCLTTAWTVPLDAVLLDEADGVH